MLSLCPAHHHTSDLSLQIDELYEAYCIKRRLRDGAHNMVKAYSTGSPGSREARESLAEASKGYKEYTEVRQCWAGLAGCWVPWVAADGCCLSFCLQNMCLLENELESQLGEFHVRMKGNVPHSIPGPLPACLLLPSHAPLPSLAGLAGFARLCAGDQYEVGGTVWVGICSSLSLWSLGCLGGHRWALVWRAYCRALLGGMAL